MAVRDPRWNPPGRGYSGRRTVHPTVSSVGGGRRNRRAAVAGLFSGGTASEPSEPAATPVIEDRITYRSDEQGQQQAEYLAANDDFGHGGASAGTGPGAERDRDHGSHEHHGGHQDGTQAGAIG